MQAILLYWFAAQQQSSTLSGQKIGLFYVEFSAEFNKLSLFFYRQQEGAKQWLKLKQSEKTSTGVVRRLKVK